MNDIILNIANEWGPANSPTWSTSYQSAISSLRTAGWTCPLLIDTGGSGQDINDLMTYSTAVFNSDPQKNIMFAFHPYGLDQGYPPGAPLSMYQTIAGQMQTLALSNGAFYGFMEFGPGRGKEVQFGGSPTDVSPAQIIRTAEANGLGWLAWAWDDNDKGGGESDNTWFCATYEGPGVWDGSTQGALTIYGQDIILNKTYGIKAMAKLATGVP